MGHAWTMTISTQHYGHYALRRKEFQNSMPSFYLGINGKSVCKFRVGNYQSVQQSLYFF
jgi:hypothetical protein